MTGETRVTSLWTTRIGPGGVEENIPRVVVDHPSQFGWNEDSANPMGDGTNPPEPNQAIVRIEGDAAYLDQVTADPLYPELPVTRVAFVGDEDPLLDVIPTQPEYGQWRSDCLAVINPDTGIKVITPGDWNWYMGSTVSARTWRVLHNDLNDWFQAANPYVPAEGFVITADVLGEGFRGYQSGDSGSINPADGLWRNMTIDRFGVSNANDVELFMDQATPDDTKNLFTRILVDGIELLTADSVFVIEGGKLKWEWPSTAVPLPGIGLNVTLVIRTD